MMIHPRGDDAAVTAPHHPAAAGHAGDRLLSIVLDAGTCVTRRRIPAGQWLFRAGTVLDSITAVLDGMLELRTLHADGAAVMMVAGPGDFVGDPAGVPSEPTSVAAIAARATTVATIPIDAFWELHGANAEFARGWATYAAHRTARYQRRLSDLLAGDVTAQVSSLLLHSAAGARAARLTQQSIADLLGVRRASVNRAIHWLERRGVLDVGYGYVRVRDRAALARVVHGPQQTPDGVTS